MFPPHPQRSDLLHPGLPGIRASALISVAVMKHTDNQQLKEERGSSGLTTPSHSLSFGGVKMELKWFTMSHTQS